MATPSTRETLKQYCLRNLGKPVIDINVDDDQVEDRIDEALQYFAQYHVDGVERMYLKYLVTEADITRMTTDASESATENSITTTYKRADNFLVVPSSVISVIKMLTPKAFEMSNFATKDKVEEFKSPLVKIVDVIQELKEKQKESPDRVYPLSEILKRFDKEMDSHEKDLIKDILKEQKWIK